MDPPAPSRTHEPETGASMSQVLGEIGRIEGKISDHLSEQTAVFQDLRAEFDKLRGDVTERLAEFSTVVSSLRSGSFSTHSGPSAAKSTESLKRDIPDARSIEHLFLLCEKERYQPPLVKYFMMLSIFCFVYDYPELHSWIPPGMKSVMSQIRPKLGDVSGFSVMYFSKTRDDKGTKFAGRIGSLWSWLISSTIVAIVLAARTNDFEKLGKGVPQWISSFGGISSALSKVEPIIECLERHNVVPLAKEGSKRHKSADAQVSEALSKDPVRGEREQSVDSLRSLVLSLLTEGRLKSRQIIFSKFLFVLEAIEDFETIPMERDSGFSIELTHRTVEAELYVPSIISGSVWDIPKTRIDSPSDVGAQNANVKMFKEHLLDKFASMNGQLRFRRVVLRSRDAAADAESYPELSDPDLHMDFSEPFNLHRIAMGILVDMFGLKDFHAVLSCRALSLRAIHITALALRGLIAKAMREELRPSEVTALGSVTHRVLEKSKNDDIATVAMGSRTERGAKRKDSAMLSKLRKARLEMTWDEYKAEKTKRRIEATLPDLSEVNIMASGNEMQSAEYGTFDLSFMDGMI